MSNFLMHRILTKKVLKSVDMEHMSSKQEEFFQVKSDV